RNNKNLEGDQSDKVDLISSLPDDILVYLLSFVGIKAAARTSLLSKRWRHVWTYITDLDFEDPPRLAIAITKPYENSEAGNYADWVNQVIRANQAQYLNTFRMHFSIPFGDKIYASNIDKWLEFACTKKVRNLELHMGTLPTIPIFKNPTFVLNTSLVSLYLTKVVVDGPLLQWVLSNCLKLGRLMLHSCMATDDVFASSKRQKLVISSLTLKHLEIFHSTRLLNTESLHIVAPNLVTLLFIESPTVDLEYVSVPSLVDAAFGGIYSTKLCNGSFLSGLSSQLEKLSLHWFKVPFQACKFPSFANVKLLELSFAWDDAKYLLVSTLSLITACPLLHTFKLKIMLWSQYDYCTRLIPINVNVAQTNAIRTLQRLEALEFVGYTGCEYAVALAYHLTQHAPMLKKFILDPRIPEQVGELSNWYLNYKGDYLEIARSRAKLLAKLIKSSVNVVIL
uniref:F-box domain-containing protein n=2 Tax=Chenopodium quinoa TaxID=63459 RepID=A0A803NBY7_CHEQI